MSSQAPQALLAALTDAKPALLDALSPVGVIRVEYVVGFVEPYRIAVWLGTSTDAQRDGLSQVDPEIDAVRRVLGPRLSDEECAWRIEGTGAQSQETVDRDYQGSWFYALR
ncbi:MAG: hypothetical protein AAGA59_12065 [Actinomycetota bacterium]